MDKVYIFSNNNLTLTTQQTNYSINQNKSVVLKPPFEQIDVCSTCTPLQTKYALDVQSANSCNFLRVADFNNCRYIEIIDTPNRELLGEEQTKLCKVHIYKNSIDVFFNGSVFCYYFNGESKNFAFEASDQLLIANQSNALVFDLKNGSFLPLFCEKTAKNDDFIEFLCKIPYCTANYLLLKGNLLTHDFSSSRYTKGSEQVEPHGVVYTFFHLIKNDCKSAKNYITQSINYADLKNYFCKFSHIKEIDGEYFLCNTTLQPVKFEILNNIITDVD